MEIGRGTIIGNWTRNKTLDYDYTSEGISFDDFNLIALKTKTNAEVLHSCEDEYVLWATLIFKGYLLLIVGLLGAVGNCLSIVVFLQKHMRKTSINILLLGLQMSDLAAVMGLMLHDGLPVVLKHLQVDYAWTVGKAWVDIFSFPIHFTAELASHGFTVLVTLERFIAVCHPLKVASLCTPRRARMASILTVIVSMILGFPTWLEWVFYLPETNPTSGLTRYRYTSGPLNGTYFEYIFYNYLTLVFMYLTPFAILIVFNAAIYLEINKSSARRAFLTQCNAKDRSTLTRNEKSLSYLMFAIVITFILCNSFQLISNVHQAARPGHNYWWLEWCIYPYTKFFLTLNSAVNFIFYCAFGKKFRTELRKLLEIYSGNNIQKIKRDANEVHLKVMRNQSQTSSTSGTSTLSMMSIVDDTTPPLTP